MTLPCPPNPVKAKKAAAVRAAKEAKMKNPVPTPLQMLEEARRREEQQDRPPPPKNRWYMGQYSMSDGKHLKYSYYSYMSLNYVEQTDLICKFAKACTMYLNINHYVSII